MSLSTATLWNSALTFDLPFTLKVAAATASATVHLAPSGTALSLAPGLGLEQAAAQIAQAAHFRVPRQHAITLTATPATKLLEDGPSHLPLAGWYGDVWCDGLIRFPELMTLASTSFTATLHRFRDQTELPKPDLTWLLTSFAQGLAVYFRDQALVFNATTHPAATLFWPLLRQAFPLAKIVVVATTEFTRREPRWKRLWQNCAIHIAEPGVNPTRLDTFPWEGWVGVDRALMHALATTLNRRSPVIPELLLR
jgi:hypothetical protein